MWQPSVLLLILLRHKLSPLRQSGILPRIVPLNNACAITADNQDMNHLHVLLRELYPLNNATHVVELDIFKVFTIPKCRDVATAHICFIAECPTLRVQQGSNQKCYVRTLFQQSTLHNLLILLELWTHWSFRS